MKKVLFSPLVLLLLCLSATVFSQEKQLIWADEFDCSGSPDPEKWNYEKDISEMMNFSIIPIDRRMYT